MFSLSVTDGFIVSRPRVFLSSLFPQQRQQQKQYTVAVLSIAAQPLILFSVRVARLSLPSH